MAQIAKLTGVSVPGTTTDHPVPHGLVRAPGIVVLLFGTHADITPGNQAVDETNIYLDNANVAAQNAEVLVMAVHSIADSNKQIDLLGGAVAVGDEVPVAHGLVRTPTIVLLCHGTDANVTIGSTPADATNIYLDNGGGGPLPYQALVMAPHSIIA